MSIECHRCKARSWGATCRECGERLLPDTHVSAGLELDTERRFEEPPPRPAARRPPRDIEPLLFTIAWSRQQWLSFAAGTLVLFVMALGMPAWARLFLACAAGACVYAALAHRFNATTFCVADGALTISHAPIPWWGARRLPLVDIEQIFVRTSFHTTGRRRWYRSNQGERIAYHVIAGLHGGQEVTLLSDISDVGEAISLERRLEGHLGIVDDRSRSLSERRA